MHLIMGNTNISNQLFSRNNQHLYSNSAHCFWTSETLAQSRHSPEVNGDDWAVQIISGAIRRQTSLTLNQTDRSLYSSESVAFLSHAHTHTLSTSGISGIVFLSDFRYIKWQTFKLHSDERDIGETFLRSLHLFPSDTRDASAAVFGQVLTSSLFPNRKH